MNVILLDSCGMSCIYLHTFPSVPALQILTTRAAQFPVGRNHSVHCKIFSSVSVLMCQMLVKASTLPALGLEACTSFLTPSFADIKVQWKDHFAKSHSIIRTVTQPFVITEFVQRKRALQLGSWVLVGSQGSVGIRTEPHVTHPGGPLAG